MSSMQQELLKAELLSKASQSASISGANSLAGRVIFRHSETRLHPVNDIVGDDFVGFWAALDNADICVDENIHM
jgi:hypothetical protein